MTQTMTELPDYPANLYSVATMSDQQAASVLFMLLGMHRNDPDFRRNLLWALDVAEVVL